MVVANRRLGRGERPADVWLEPDDVRWFTSREMQPWAYRAPGPVWRQRQRDAAQRLIEDGLDALSRTAAGVLGGEATLVGAGVGALDGLAPQVPRRAGQRTYRESRPRAWSAERKRRFATRFVPTVTVALSAAVAAPFVLRPDSSSVRATDTIPAGASPATPAPDTGGDAPSVTAASSTAGPGATADRLELELRFAPPPAVSEPIAADPPAAPAPAPAPAEPAYDRIVWHRSQSHGLPYNGQLHHGVALPIEGPRWVTWDPVHDRVPNRRERLYGADGTIRKLLAVLRKYRKANPDAPKVVIGDLSRKGGGPLDAHVSHQNGLDVDVYYPRLDRKLRDPGTTEHIDLELSQDLVDLFVAAGAQFVFIGYHTPLSGPRAIVQPYQNHENHMHVRFRP